MLVHRTSADLFKTAFDLLVSVTLFLGRFDMRTMQVMYWHYSCVRKVDKERAIN